MGPPPGVGNRSAYLVRTVLSVAMVSVAIDRGGTAGEVLGGFIVLTNLLFLILAWTAHRSRLRQERESERLQNPLMTRSTRVPSRDVTLRQQPPPVGRGVER